MTLLPANRACVYCTVDDGETQSETTDDGKYDRSAEGSEEESTDMESAEAAFGLSLHDDDAHGIEDAVENSYVELESLRAAVDFAEQEGLPVRDRQIFLRRFFDHFNSSPSPGAGDGRSSSPNASDAGYSLMGDLSSVGSTPMKTEDRKKAYSAQAGGPQGGGRGGTHAASPGDAATLSEDDISASASHDSATGPGGRGGVLHPSAIWIPNSYSTSCLVYLRPHLRAQESSSCFSHRW